MEEITLVSKPDINADLSHDEIRQGGLATEEMLINMGPQHPATHGVLRVVLRTDGEMVLETVPHIGYLHRCAEKIGESLAPYQFIPYTDRMDYLAGMNNNLAYALAIEKLAGLEVSKRAQYIRIVASELNRIASHLVMFGTYGLDIGAFTPFLYAFREREWILDLFESLCGARLTYSYITIGGVTQDLPDRFIDLCEEFLDYFDPKIDEYNNLLSFNHIFVKRTADVGVISAEDAVKWGLTGPCLRGSGVRWDLRKVEPNCGYEEFDFDIPIGQGLKGTVGDSWDRYFVRMEEMKQSVRIIRQVLKKLRDTDGDVLHKKNRSVKLPEDEVYLEIENPRGQLGFYVQGNGTTVPARVKARGPCFNNLSITSHVCRGCLLADVGAILGSFDVVLGEVDR
ncbi:MAG: NADH-quinone oxidoreductase subunit D [Planctomycetota bacterium]